MKKYKFYYMAIFLVFFSTGCIEAVKGVTTYGPTAIQLAAGTSKATRPVSDSEEYFIGRSVAVKILGIYPLSTDEELIQYVNLI